MTPQTPPAGHDTAILGQEEGSEDSLYPGASSPPAAHPSRHRLTALMFTDIVGYSRMMGEDEERTVNLLEHYRRILGEVIEGHAGVVIEFIGDAVFARFDSGLEAARAAVEIQRRLRAFNEHHHPDEPPRRQLRSRIGLHLGEVLEKDGRIFGDDINIAARIEPLARPGAVCISDAIYQQIWNHEEFAVVPMGPWRLKNISERVRLYQLFPADTIDPPKRLSMQAGYLARRMRSRSLAMAGLLAVLLLAISLTLFQPPEESARARYLTIESFRNLSPESIEGYLAEGITETITAQLTTIPNLYVVPAEEEIGAPFMLEGSIQKVNERIRIAYRLVRRKDKARLGGGVMDGARRDIFQLQDEVASAIAQTLSRELDLPSVRLATSRITTDLTAYDFYLQARSYMRRGIDAQDVESAIALYRRALERDPSFARAHAGLCEAKLREYERNGSTRLVTEAEQACRRALELDDGLAEVHIAQGDLYARIGRYDEAIRAFNRAIELDPKATEAYSGMARAYSELNQLEEAERALTRAVELQPGYWGSYNILGFFYTEHGRFEEAIRAFRRVIELTPDNAVAFSNLGGALFMAGRIEEAAEAFREGEKIRPTAIGYNNVGTLYYYAGLYGDAAEMYHKAIELEPENPMLWSNLADSLIHLGSDVKLVQEARRKATRLAQERLELNPDDAMTLAFLAHLYSENDEREKAAEMAQRALELRPNVPMVQYYAAATWNHLGEREKLFEGLRRALQLGMLPRQLEMDPDFSNLRNDPEYRRLLASSAEGE